MSSMPELESRYNAIVDRLQMLPVGLDDSYSLIFAFSRLGRPDDLERKSRHQQVLGPMPKVRAIVRRSEK
jgi:hypothetical protein